MAANKSQLLQAVPLHRQVYRQLRRDILNGVYAQGTQIPTEADLIDRFGVSKITIRRAVQDLIAERLLVGQRGKGTFVKSGKFIGAARLLFLHAQETPTGHPYTQLILDGVTEAADTEHLARLELATRPEIELQSDDDTTLEDLVEHAGIEGIVALPRIRQASLERLAKMDVPVAIVGRIPFPIPAGVINVGGGSTAAIECQLNHLAEIGSAKIGVLTNREPQSSNHLSRVHDAMKSRGMTVVEEAFQEVDYGINDGQEGAVRLLKRCPKIDTILAEDDLGAIGAFQAALELGIKVPSELRIIGCGNMVGDHSHCNVTTIDTKLKLAGKTAVDAVLQLMDGQKVENLIDIPPELIRRKTT